MTAAAPAAPAAALAAAEPLARYHCAACTYGVSVLRLPQRCPMCGGHVWKPDLRKE